MRGLLVEKVRASAIAEVLEAPLQGPDVLLVGVCSLARMRPYSLTFAMRLDQVQADMLNAITNTLVLTTREFARMLIGAPHIVLDNPRLGYAKAAQTFFAPRPSGIAPTARIDPSAFIGERVFIGEFVVVERGVCVGDHCTIDHHAVIKQGTTLGQCCSVGANSSVGTMGFGLENDGDGEPVRIPQLGGITIGNYVEIGANTVIARGTIDNTEIDDHVKIDDHVFIAHNVKIGEGTYVIAGAEISGSVQLGKRVWVAPQVTILNQIKVGDGAILGIGAVVRKDVEPGTVVAGNPARVLASKVP